MTDLVCCLSTGKGTWIEVTKLINYYDWRNIFLITNDFGKEKFTSEKPIKFILVDINKGTESVKKTIQEALEGKVSGDVALNMNSGSGLEHMAMLTAMINLGVGLRFVIPTDTGIKEI